MLIQTSQEKQSLIFRYIGQLEGIIEGSTLDKTRYDELKLDFEHDLDNLNDAIESELEATAKEGGAE